jgi:hypothetical protein
MSHDYTELIARLRRARIDHALTVTVDGMFGEAADAIEALVAERDAAVADARRYRYWRKHHGWTGYFDDGLSNSDDHADVDAAIDAAIAKEKP